MLGCVGDVAVFPLLHDFVKLAAGNRLADPSRPHLDSNINCSYKAKAYTKVVEMLAAAIMNGSVVGP